MQNTISLDEIVSQIRDREIDIAHMKGDLVEGKKAMDAAKLPAYAEVFAFIGSNTGGTLDGLVLVAIDLAMVQLYLDVFRTPAKAAQPAIPAPSPS